MFAQDNIAKCSPSYTHCFCDDGICFDTTQEET